MAPTPIELSLHSLLPTLSNLPLDLISLAQSLLSQSKIHAAHLKPDEEVGRIYACCHIAAERLRARHGFEVGKPRPPVPPRVYSKLKGFLEGVLETPTTPKGGRMGGAASGALGNGSAKKTPESKPTSMRKRWAEARRPKSQGEDVVGHKSGLETPRYAMPMIRHLCKVCDVGKAAPHVFTGVSVVLKAYGRSPSQEINEDAGTHSSGRKRKRGADEEQENRGTLAEDDVPGVILALWTAVVRRMFGAEKLMELRHLEAVKHFAAAPKSGLPPSASEEGYFDDALPRFDFSEGGACEKWTELDWFGNVPEADTASKDTQGDQTAETGDGDGDEDEDAMLLTPRRKKPAKTPLRRKEKHGAPNDDHDITRAGLLPGLGTMFQPAVDWLSDERVLEYERWRKEMEREIRIIEQSA